MKRPPADGQDRCSCRSMTVEVGFDDRSIARGLTRQRVRAERDELGRDRPVDELRAEGPAPARVIADSGRMGGESGRPDRRAGRDHRDGVVVVRTTV
jgi:hypothetical protein